MYIKRRDYRVIKFIQDFGCATTNQLHKLFFNDVTLRACQDRLTVLSGWKHLNRERESVNSDYLYWIGDKPKQIAHDLARVDFYISIDDKYQVAEFVPEYKIGDVRADAYFEIYKNGYNLPLFLEVQLSAGFRQDKYEHLYQSGAWLDKWPEFPAVVVVPDGVRLKQGNVKFIKGGELDVLLCNAGRDLGYQFG